MRALAASWFRGARRGEALDADYELIGTVGGDELRIGDLSWDLNALTGARETLAPAFA